MSYVELTEVKSILAAVDSQTDQDWQGTAAQLPDTLLEIHIADAEAHVNATLGRTYAIPFDPVPQLVKAITTAIACYFADLTYRKSTGYQNANYPVILRYQWALNQLELLRTSKITLEPLTEAENQDGLLIHANPGPLFPPEIYLYENRWWRSDY